MEDNLSHPHTTAHKHTHTNLQHTDSVNSVNSIQTNKQTIDVHTHIDKQPLTSTDINNRRGRSSLPANHNTADRKHYKQNRTIIFLCLVCFL